jgi:hypothetical protein
MNLLNFFNTFTGCTNGVGGAATDCRGAGNQAEFDRQWPKTVAAITGTQADVVGVTEVENDGYGTESAIQFLVNQLNAATAPGTYAFIDADAGTGQINALGLDAIKVALIYKPAKVTPVGTTAALNTEAFVNGGDSVARNRPSLAQAFQENSTGARFVVDVNHLKSKGSGCTIGDAGDGQGGCNGVRTQAANELTTWLASDPTETGDPDALIIGDLNAYAMEDPITAIQAAGYTDLAKQFEGNTAYSYVFDGQWGYLDHALSNASLTSQVTGVADWHINSDEPSVLDYNTDFKTANQISNLYAPDQFRVADHDPVLIDLNLTTPAVIETSFVTGSGWITSPTGAFTADPSLSGKAPFELTVKYKKGATTPDGYAAFQFKAGNLLFQSTTLDWLAINLDATLAEFKGTGTINGGGSYGFIIWATDGKKDSFRIKIWDSATYDSQTTTLGGGSITIHK